MPPHPGSPEGHARGGGEADGRRGPGEARAQLHQPASAGGCGKVLVIDDDDADRVIVARALRKVRPNVEIVEAASAAAGIELIDAECPDLVLLDLRMAGVDGFAVLASAKTGSRRAEVPVVVLSTSSNPDDVRRAYRLNANAYVQKPSSMDDYEELAKRLVEFWMETTVRA